MLVYAHTKKRTQHRSVWAVSTCKLGPTPHHCLLFPAEVDTLVKSVCGSGVLKHKPACFCRCSASEFMSRHILNFKSDACKHVTQNSGRLNDTAMLPIFWGGQPGSSATLFNDPSLTSTSSHRQTYLDESWTVSWTSLAAAFTSLPASLAPSLASLTASLTADLESLAAPLAPSFRSSAVNLTSPRVFLVEGQQVKAWYNESAFRDQKMSV